MKNDRKIVTINPATNESIPKINIIFVFLKPEYFKISISYFQIVLKKIFVL